MATPLPIIFFGTESFSVATLKRLIEDGHTIAAVVTKPDSKKGRGQHLLPPEVKVVAQQHNIPVWQPTDLLSIADAITSLQPTVGVLVSYGRIVPQAIIDLFTPGIINVHPSLLPRYRGPSPIESAILNGDTQTGISIMQLVRAMDAGPVYTQATYELDGTETAPELYDRLAARGAELLAASLRAIVDGELAPTPQNNDLASYCQLLNKKDSLINPAAVSAAEAERQVRAYLAFPKSKIALLGHEVIVTKAHVSTTKKTPLDIECRDGAFLSIDELVTPNGRRTDAAGFLRGYAN